MEWRSGWWNLAREDTPLSLATSSHMLSHSVSFLLSVGSSPLHTQQKGMSAVLGLPFSRGEAGILTGFVEPGEEWRNSGSCWHGGLLDRELPELWGSQGLPLFRGV